MEVPRFLRPLKELPGLRSRNRPVQVVAALYYGFLALLLVAGVFGGVASFIQSVLLVAVFVAPIAVSVVPESASRSL